MLAFVLIGSTAYQFVGLNEQKKKKKLFSWIGSLQVETHNSGSTREGNRTGREGQKVKSEWSVMKPQHMQKLRQIGIFILSFLVVNQTHVKKCTYGKLLTRKGWVWPTGLQRNASQYSSFSSVNVSEDLDYNPVIDAQDP